jgi:Gas vesicle synthesis protein GvpO
VSDLPRCRGKPLTSEGIPLSEPSNVSIVARVRKVREQLHELTGCEPVSISGLARVGDGWELAVDVVEVRRVPDTASLLATYRVTTDDSGGVAGYERVRRFNRGEAD